MKKYMLKSQLLLLVLLIFISPKIYAQPNFLLQLSPEIVDVSGTNYLDVTISMAGSASFDLGSCNLQFTFDTNIELSTGPVKIPSYNLNAFFAAPTVTEPSTNKASLNLVLYIPENGKNITASGSGWTELATIRFDILDPAGLADLDWSYNGGTTETVVFMDDETTQIFVNSPGSDLVNANGVILPVEFTYLEAEWFSMKERTAKIKWQTASESNSNVFEIQRSDNSKDWENIGEVAAAGFSNTVIDYEFSDGKTHEILGNTLYYRIRSVDLAGQKDLTNVVALQRSQFTFETQIFPTVFQNEINILLISENNFDENIQIDLMDTQGKSIRQFTMKSNENYLLQNLNELQSGTYFLQIADGNFQRMEKVVKY